VSDAEQREPRPPEDEMTMQLEDEEAEWVAEDDTIIGRSFWWSLVVIVGLAVVIGLVFYLTRPSEDIKPEQVIAPVAPERVEQTAVVPTVRFTDITREAGIHFVHVNGAYGDKLLPETMGGGVAFLDYDNDGDADLLLVNSAFWPHRPSPESAPTLALYQNDGAGRFQDVTAQAGLAVSFYGMGVAVADYDGDGWTDIFFTAVGQNRLFRNGQGVFEDVTAQAGVAGDAQEWSTSAGFFDYDNDGDLDLFVANYVRWSKEIDFQLDYRLTGVGRAYGPPQNYEGSFPYLYRNNGDGTFTDVSADSGIQVKNPATGAPMAKSLAVALMDVDGDRRMDIFVANDTVQNYFFHNLGAGTFEEVGELYGLAYGSDGKATGAMGVDVGHFRNDHTIGFLIGNFANEMTSVYVSQDTPTFYVDDAIGEGIGAPSRLALTFGLFLFDYELDGRLDMLQANGHIETEIHKIDPSQKYLQAAQLFWNAGPEHVPRFVPVSPDSLGDLTREIVGRGAAFADIDSDGDLDVVLTQIAGAPLVLRNDQDLGHHWLRVRLNGKAPNRDAIGAWIELTAGGVVQRRQVMPTRSYLSQVERTVTFGLGSADRIDALKVVWPDASEQTVQPVPVDQLLVLEQRS
jgi:enediyne biosynthesis protein E4